jgi:hypothetical protein
MLGYQRKNDVGNLRDIDRNIISKNICALLGTFCPPRSLNTKFGARRKEEKLY